ncbi:MAG: TRL domain-containing protein [Candidatus Brocadiia bacterium]
MVKRLAAVALVVVVAVVLTGCCIPKGAVMAPIMMTKSPVAVGDPSVSAAKTGEAYVEGIILLAKGDSSIEAAMKDGGISRIHHVDSEETNILGIYCKSITRVYGE